MIAVENVKFVNSFPNPNQGRFDKSQWLHDYGLSNVILNCHAKQIYYPDHWTPLSLKCSFNGKEFYQSGNAIQCASDDNFLIFNEGKEYTSFINSDTEVESFTLNFSEPFVKFTLNALFADAAINLDDPCAERIKTNIRFIERGYTYNATLKNQVLLIRHLTKEFQLNNEHIAELLLSLLENLIAFRQKISAEVNDLDAAKASTRAELYKRLYMVKDLLDSSYQTDINLNTLASVALLNPCYLLRLFKSFFKITPWQYLKRRRIDEAKKLLATGKYPVAQVCNMVGFSDLSSFSKLFKKETGFSPCKFSAMPGL